MDKVMFNPLHPIYHDFSLMDARQAVTDRSDDLQD
jgi:hypothetical protein